MPVWVQKRIFECGAEDLKGLVVGRRDLKFRMGVVGIPWLGKSTQVLGLLL